MVRVFVEIFIYNKLHEGDLNMNKQFKEVNKILKENVKLSK
jgi:hypothetical protein